MKQLKSPDVAPPGGWRYQDPDTGFKFRRRYQTLADLALHVEKYRDQNGLPRIPSVSLVIQYWLCEQPNMERYCHEAPSPSRTLAQYLSGAKAAMKMKASGEDAFESQEIAEARAVICVQCRHNKKNSNHSRLEQYTDEYVQDIVGDRTTPFDKSLFSCEICSCNLRSKVHISQKIVQSSLSRKESMLLNMGVWGKNGKQLKCWQVFPVETSNGEEV